MLGCLQFVGKSAVPQSPAALYQGKVPVFQAARHFLLFCNYLFFYPSSNQATFLSAHTAWLL